MSGSKYSRLCYRRAFYCHHHVPFKDELVALVKSSLVKKVSLKSQNIIEKIQILIVTWTSKKTSLYLSTTSPAGFKTVAKIWNWLGQEDLLLIQLYSGEQRQPCVGRVAYLWATWVNDVICCDHKFQFSRSLRATWEPGAEETKLSVTCSSLKRRSPLEIWTESSWEHASRDLLNFQFWIKIISLDMFNHSITK